MAIGQKKAVIHIAKSNPLIKGDGWKIIIGLMAVLGKRNQKVIVPLKP